MTELSDYHVRARAEWAMLFRDLFKENIPDRSVWFRDIDIVSVLNIFMGPAKGHAFFPTGGGLDFHSVTISRESECIEFGAGGKTAYICRPKSLTLDHFLDRPGESFLTVELQELSLAYPGGQGAGYAAEKGREEILDLGSGKYLDRVWWDEQRMPPSDEGDDVPLPRTARLVERYLRGKMLIVSKGSLWNRVHGTYDARHNRMSIDAIRSAIEGAASELEARLVR